MKPEFDHHPLAGRIEIVDAFVGEGVRAVPNRIELEFRASCRTPRRLSSICVTALPIHHQIANFFFSFGTQRGWERLGRSEEISSARDKAAPDVFLSLPRRQLRWPLRLDA